jgi:predicted  nucleic acid-binding Zn-ribbon protein
MSEEIDRLWALQGLDEQALAVRSVLARFPEQRRELEHRVAEARQRLEQAKARLGESQKQRRELERQAGALGEQERHFQQQLPAIKKNEEYTALLHEIEGTRSKRSELETQVLLRMEEEEREQQERPVLEQALKSAEAEAAERAKRIGAEEAAEREKLGVLEARREANVRELPASTRARYERVHGSRDGRAVVAILKGACGGCYRTLPPAVLQEARRRDRMMSCEGCGRIIIWPPDEA